MSSPDSLLKEDPDLFQDLLELLGEASPLYRPGLFFSAVGLWNSAHRIG